MMWCHHHSLSLLCQFQLLWNEITIISFYNIQRIPFGIELFCFTSKKIMNGSLRRRVLLIVGSDLSDVQPLHDKMSCLFSLLFSSLIYFLWLDKNKVVDLFFLLWRTHLALPPPISIHPSTCLFSDLIGWRWGTQEKKNFPIWLGSLDYYHDVVVFLYL